MVTLHNTDILFSGQKNNNLSKLLNGDFKLNCYCILNPLSANCNLENKYIVLAAYILEENKSYVQVLIKEYEFKNNIYKTRFNVCSESTSS
jgi:hypothetical protein